MNSKRARVLVIVENGVAEVLTTDAVETYTIDLDNDGEPDLNNYPEEIAELARGYIYDTAE